VFCLVHKINLLKPTGQPDNQDGTEQCVVLRKNYELHDHKCSQPLKFFCMAKEEKRKLQEGEEFGNLEEFGDLGEFLGEYLGVFG
jgi:hypothetical protein